MADAEHEIEKREEESQHRDAPEEEGNDEVNPAPPSSLC